MKAELIDNMGSDLTVVNAARVSFDKESDLVEVVVGDVEKQILPTLGLSDKDKKLISYLAKHNHFTPFTHAVITLRETVPIFVARQRFKHTVGFTYNEVSRRYVDDAPEFYQPKEWRGRADNVKQGSSEVIISTSRLDGYYDNAVWQYNNLLELGVAPEQARMVLPQSMYTSYYCTGSLSAFARAYKLRSDAHSQKEIQELAAQWNDIISPLYPESWKALTE